MLLRVGLAFEVRRESRARCSPGTPRDDSLVTADDPPPKATTYAPGQTIDLTTTYGVAVCDQPRPIEPPHAVAALGPSGIPWGHTPYDDSASGHSRRMHDELRT
ncbi:MAG: hypothetical protein M3O94_10050, partial [Actinomycetota bacterium]|nr:hypothetical protein [Actinomycetota bacterium]